MADVNKLDTDETLTETDLEFFYRTHTSYDITHISDDINPPILENFVCSCYLWTKYGISRYPEIIEFYKKKNLVGGLNLGNTKLIEKERFVDADEGDEGDESDEGDVFFDAVQDMNEDIDEDRLSDYSDARSEMV